MQAISKVKIDLDVTKNRGHSIFTKSVDTKTRFVVCRIIAGDTRLNLEGCQAKVYAVKPDGTKVYNSCEITDAEKGEVTFEITSQMSAVPGLVKCELEINGEDMESLSTPKFYLNVDETLRDDDAIESSNEFSALTEAINKVGDFAAIADSAGAAAAAAQEAAHSASQAASRANQAANGFVPDGSVIAETLSGARANLFDKAASADANILPNGTLDTSEPGYLCTGYIQVRPGSTYTFPAGRRRHIALYAADKSFLRYIDGGTSNLYVAPLTMPTDIPVAWLRISYYIVDTPLTPDNFMVCVGGEYYGEYILHGETRVDWLNTKIADGAISAEKMQGVYCNLLDLTKLESGYLNSTTGAITNDGENAFVTDWIPVAPKKSYSLTSIASGLVCFYDSEKMFISSTAILQVTTPANAEYLRMSVRDTQWTRLNWMCVIGSVYPDFYVPYGKPYIPWLDNNPLTGKQLLVLGDSITEYRKCHINGVAYQNNMAFDRTTHNQSVSGTPLAKLAAPDGTSFVERFESLIAPGGAWAEVNPDYFVLDGGVNDCRLNLPIGAVAPADDFDGELDEYTACGALEKIIRLARKKWPRCFIGYFTSYDFPTLGWRETKYYNALKIVCKKYAVPVLDLRSVGNFTQSIPEQEADGMRDDMHINAMQNIRYIPLFESFLKTRGAAFGATDERISDDFKKMKSAIEKSLWETPNVFNWRTVTEGKLLDSNGNVVDGENASCVSEAIEIPAGAAKLFCSYTTTAGAFGAQSQTVHFYDINMKHISGKYAKEFDIPQGAKYLRMQVAPFIYNAGAHKTVMLEFADVMSPEFYPYGVRVKETAEIPALTALTAQVAELEKKINNLSTALIAIGGE